MTANITCLLLPYSYFESTVMTANTTLNLTSQPGMKRVVPVWREESKHNFVSSDLIMPHAVKVGDHAFLTAPLLPRRKMSLLGMTTTEELLACGEVSDTDALDPEILLEALYLRAGESIFKLNTCNIPRSQYFVSLSGQYHVLSLEFKTTLLLLGHPNITYFSGLNAQLNELQSSVPSLFVEANSDCDIETGVVELTASAKIVDKHHNLIAVDVIGYDLNISRRNPNRLSV